MPTANKPAPLERASATANSPRKVERHHLVRLLFLVAGLLCVGLGLLGALLPLLPTTPFLLLAAACFARSSTRMHHWLHHNRLFGAYIQRYRAGDGMPLRAKVMTLLVMWLSLGYSAVVAVPAHWWPLAVILLLIGVATTVHILRLKTYRLPTSSCPER